MKPPGKYCWFEGMVPAKAVSVGINKIIGVRGARGVVHRDFIENTTTRYDIVDKKIVRPDREPEFQFLVVTVGCELDFETDDETVFVVGTTSELGPGKTIPADMCFFPKREEHGEL